jgi:hypothetical protein
MQLRSIFWQTKELIQTTGICHVISLCARRAIHYPSTQTSSIRGVARSIAEIAVLLASA